MLRRLITGMIMAAASLLAAGSNAATGANDEQPATCLKLGADPSLGENFSRFEALFDDWYGRIGVCVRSVAITPKRIEQLLQNGELDGDWFRPDEFVRTHKLEDASVPQPLFDMAARIMWLDTKKFSGNPEDMAGLTVGYRAGFRWLERHIPMTGAHAFPVSSSSQVKMLLERGRIDLYATGALQEPGVRAQFGPSGPRITSAYWTSVPFLHILHARHKALLPLLHTALQQMIKSGDIAPYLTIPGVAVPGLLTR
jgi:hypothetical protein